jgi:sugar lactone lactonase YvrE
MKLTKKTITNSRELHAQSVSKGICSISFTANVALDAFVASVDSFGHVLPEQYQVIETKYVELKSDQFICGISDVCQLPDGRIVLTDLTNRKIKMLDLEYNVNDSCVLDAFPFGICCISSNEVAIKMDNNTVQFVSVETSLSKTRCISISGGQYYGMTYCDGGLWVSTGNGTCINIYNISGTFIKSVGTSIFRSFIKHMSVNGDTVIVTDGSYGVICYNKDGTVMRELRDSRLRNSAGACAADDGTVFVCGYESHNIVMFSKDGDYKREIVPYYCGLNNPFKICYDKNKNTLIVTFCQSNIVTVAYLI